jgi:hypothetical protein
MAPRIAKVAMGLFLIERLSLFVGRALAPKVQRTANRQRVSREFLQISPHFGASA